MEKEKLWNMHNSFLFSISGLISKIQEGLIKNKKICNNSSFVKFKKKSFSHFSKYRYDAMNVLKRNQRINAQRSFQ